MATATVHRLTIYPLMIPLRRRMEHAASRRGVADPIVIAVELTNGVVGYGETLPRAYVTDETMDSVIDALRSVFFDALFQFQADSFPQALEALDSLPWHDATGRAAPAARAAVELALLDAVMQTFQRNIEDVVQWMGLPGFGRPGSIGRVRFSAVLAEKDCGATRRLLRLTYWAGLRAFKLKVGVRDDYARLEMAARYLRRPLARSSVSLRLDANGCWSAEAAEEWLARARRFPIEAVEQPLAKGGESELPELRRRTGVPIIHDESLITVQDAERLIEMGVADGFNIRISKCGGLLPSLRLARLAQRSGTAIQMGCMVGETSILSAAGLLFLQVCPGVRWAEGCLGTYLLRSDVTERSLRIGYGGRPPALRGPGLGIKVSTDRLREHCEDEPITIQF